VYGNGVICVNQSRLNVLGGPGPTRLMGPLSFLWPTWRGGAVVLCASESGNTHLGFNLVGDVSMFVDNEVKLIWCVTRV